MLNPHRKSLTNTYDQRAEDRDEWSIDQWTLGVATDFLSRLPVRPAVLDVDAGTSPLSTNFMDSRAMFEAIGVAARHVAICTATILKS